MTVVFIALALVLLGGRVMATQSFSRVTDGGAQKMATETRNQGADVVHDEVAACTHGTHGTPQTLTFATGSNLVSIPTTSATRLFTSPTFCHSAIILNESGSTGMLYANYNDTIAWFGIALGAMPIPPGQQLQMRPDLTAGAPDCSTIRIGCAGTCVAQVLVQ